MQICNASFTKNCHIIPSLPRGESTSLAEMREAFSSAPRLSLTQSWLDEIEKDFQPGSVAIGQFGRSLRIFAELKDYWIHNSITEKNCPAFLHGDTFEIFLKAENRPDYWELHITPDNVTMQLHFPGPAPCHGSPPDSLESHLVRESAFRSLTWKSVESWSVLADIPLDLFGASKGTIVLEANFARYDYLPGRHAPVLSATAILTQPMTFHDQRGWSHLEVRLPSAFIPPRHHQIL